MTDEELRIRGYLQAQGAKLSPAAIIDKVRAAMAHLRAAAESIPTVRFPDRPVREEWSGNEVMDHVLEADRNFNDQIVAVLVGVGHPPATRETREAPVRTAEEWCALLERHRGVLFERVLRADPQNRLAATIDHGMFGPLNWRETLLFLRLHDLDHAGPLRKIAAVLAAA